tara:strand:- start:29030 stop:29212 length:183 start_codon:yes stop_codon:yes gene_type:complete
MKQDFSKVSILFIVNLYSISKNEFALLTKAKRRSHPCHRTLASDISGPILASAPFPKPSA